jgi:hypothetical protein
MALDLPELSTRTWEKWEDAAWECIIYSTCGHPEKLSALRILGRNKANLDGLGGQRTKDANVKAEIRQTLKEAIQKLSAGDSE